jgi:hypothetical protein
MADALFPRRCRIDRLQWEGVLDQFLAAFDGVVAGHGKGMEQRLARVLAKAPNSLRQVWAA